VNADDSQPIVEPDSSVRDTPRHRTVGITTDLGVPDGAAVGLVVRPKFDWLRLGAAGTYNGMAPGARLGVTFDPIAFAVGPTFTVEGGHSWQGRLPVGNAPTMSYSYANFHLGVELGNRATFRFFLRAGASWIDGGTASSQGGTSASNSEGLGSSSYRGWLAPSGKLGFAAYF
jgi:hypothetical protein